MGIEYVPYIPKGSTSLVTSDGYVFYSRYLTGITLYQYSSEDNRVDKSGYLTEVANLDGTFRQECDILRPSILFEIESLPRFNYVYIPEFNRYYFVRSFSSVQRKIWKVELEVDVLYTYRSSILSSTAYVERNEHTFNTHLRDSVLTFETDPTYRILTDMEHSPFNISMVEPQIHESTGELLYFDTAYRYVVNGVVDQKNLFKHPRTTMATNFASNHIAVLNGFQFGGMMLDFAQRTLSDVSKLWEGNPVQAINSLMIYPFDVKDALKLTADDYTSALYLGSSSVTRPTDWDLENTQTTGGTVQCYLAREKASDNSRLYIGSIDLRSFGDNWYEYDSKIVMYYPFFGFKEVDPKIVLGKWINVYCLVDYNDGSGTYYTYVSDDFTGRDTIVSVDRCTLGIQLPIGYDQKQGQGLNEAVSAITSVVGGVNNKNPAQVISGVTNMMSVFASNITIGGTYSGSAWSGSSGPLHLECHMLLPRPVENSNYGHEFGYPLHESTSLSSLTGFTKVGEVHLVGFSTATTEEKNSIETQLKDGVIF